MNRTLYLGWDVGGWEGQADGLAVLQLSTEGRLSLCSRPKRLGLKEALRDAAFSVCALLNECCVSYDGEHVVIGVDAPLAWPREAVRLVSGGCPRGVPYLPDEGGEAANRYAYRLCDRVVRRRCAGKKPLSATFDRLGNNATKAMVACQRLAASDGAVVAPQHGTDGDVVVCEVYPALWKQGGRKAGAPERWAAETLGHTVMPSPGTDEADAVLCALAAACYDNQVRGLGLGLPRLHTPADEAGCEDADPDLEALVAEEGWIYFPVETMA